MKILYIEDYEELAELVITVLKNNGYEVGHYKLGQEGLARFHQNPQEWDAVIIDLGLPDIAGQDIIPKIAKQCPATPIIVYSGANEVKERFELYTSGASALLSKPCCAQDLLDVLKGLIDMPPAPIKG